MSGYLGDILLVLSVIAAPVIFATLLYHGLTISDRKHQEVDNRQSGNRARRASAPTERGRNEKSA